MPLVRTIAILNQKGGVGKTTTVANLGAALANYGKRVGLIDLDPQAHLTLHFGIEPGTPEVGIYDVLTSELPFDQAIVRPREDVFVCPAVIDLAAAEVELVTTVGREQILRDSLAASSADCDYLLIDCPPSLGLLTLNALAAADEVFIPLQPHFLALQGLGKLLETVSLVQKRINPGLRVTGVILCMFESNTRLAGEVVADLRDFFGSSRDQNVPWSDARLFESVIRRNVKLAECPSHGQTIFQYEPDSNGAADYNALAGEVLAMLEGRIGADEQVDDDQLEEWAAGPAPSDDEVPVEEAPAEAAEPPAAPAEAPTTPPGQAASIGPGFRPDMQLPAPQPQNCLPTPQVAVESAAGEAPAAGDVAAD